MKYIKLFESFSISGEFRKFVNDLPSVKAAFEDDTKFSFVFNLYENPMDELDAEYIIVSTYSTGNGNEEDYDEDDFDDDGYESGYNETEYFVYRNGTFHSVTAEEDEMIRAYEDDGNYFLNMDAEDTIDISQRVRDINRMERNMKPDVVVDDQKAIANTKAFIKTLKHVSAVKPQNKLSASKRGGSITAKRMDYLDPEFHYSFSLFTNDQPNLKKNGITHFMLEYYTNSNESERTFYVLYNSGESIRVANHKEDDLYRERDDESQYFDADDLSVAEVFNYFGDVVSQTEEEYQQEAYKSEQYEILKMELEQALESEEYEKAREIQHKLDQLG
jgi:hypothetical protein